MLNFSCVNWTELTKVVLTRAEFDDRVKVVFRNGTKIFYLGRYRLIAFITQYYLSHRLQGAPKDFEKFLLVYQDISSRLNEAIRSDPLNSKQMWGVWV
jgi:hypothetical protein